MLIVLAENKPNVLARIAGQLGRRNVNIDYLTSHNLIGGDRTVVTIGFMADESVAELIPKAVERLVNVLEVTCRAAHYPEYSDPSEVNGGLLGAR